MHDSQSPRPAGNPFPDHGAPPPAAVQLRLDQAGSHLDPLPRARAAWDDLVAAGIPPAAQLVYLRLALRANTAGVARCSSTQLARELGRHQPRVKGDLRLLARRGFITPLAVVEGVLVAGGPARDRVGYEVPAMRAAIRAV